MASSKLFGAHRFFQPLQTHRCFHVHLQAISDWAKRIGMGIGRGILVVAGKHEVSIFEHGSAFLRVKQLLGQLKRRVIGIILLHVTALVVGVNTLIHERMFALVGSQDTIKPVVPNFVGNDIIQVFLGAAGVANHRNHWVLHAAARAEGRVDRRGLRPGVFAYFFGIKFHRARRT